MKGVSIFWDDHVVSERAFLSHIEELLLGTERTFQRTCHRGIGERLETYPVFHLDFGIGTYTNANALDQVLDTYLSEWEEEYKVVRKPNITDFRT